MQIIEFPKQIFLRNSTCILIDIVVNLVSMRLEQFFLESFELTDIDCMVQCIAAH